MQIEIISLDSLKPYERNAKKHTAEQIKQIKESITKFGNNDPIAIWGDENIIIEGHGRYVALRELGYEECECIRLDHLTEEERKAYTLAHNKLTMNTDFDDDLLLSELDELRDFFDMSAFGFFDDEEDEEEAEEEEEITPEIEFTEVLEEENNYIVLFFDNAIDWLQAETLFDLKTVKGLSTRKDGGGESARGTGRVLNGAKALSKIMDWGVKE